MRQIVLDTETTGLTIEDGHRIIEIGCLELINRRITGNHFHYYINPEREIDAEALKVHGITHAFLKDKPLFRDVAEEFLAYVKDSEIIIHNAPFDVGFINFEFSKMNPSPQPLETVCRIFDTLVLARQLHMGQRNSLDALCKRYGVDNTERELHGALLDAHLTAQVFLNMTGGQSSLFDEKGVEEKRSRVTQRVETKKIHSDFTIIQANADELQLHEKWLALLRKNGKCIWEDK